jgi:hypothetical protein
MLPRHAPAKQQQGQEKPIIRYINPLPASNSGWDIGTCKSQVTFILTWKGAILLEYWNSQ